MATWKEFTYSRPWYAHAEDEVVIGARRSNSLCSLNTASSASQVVSSVIRLKNPLCPSATSFIKLPLLLQTGQCIPQGLVYFLLQERSAWLCCLTEPSVVPQPLNIYVFTVGCRDISPHEEERVEDRWVGIRWALTGMRGVKKEEEKMDGRKKSTRWDPGELDAAVMQSI